MWSKTAVLVLCIALVHAAGVSASKDKKDGEVHLQERDQVTGFDSCMAQYGVYSEKEFPDEDLKTRETCEARCYKVFYGGPNDLQYKKCWTCCNDADLKRPTVPTVFSITPNSGYNVGGDFVTIKGRLFGSATNDSNVVQVTIGGRDATHCKVNSTSVITCLTPPGAGRKQPVQVTVRGATGPAFDLYSYPAARDPDAAVFGVGNSYDQEPQSVFTSRIIKSKTSRRVAMQVHADIDLRAQEAFKAVLSCGAYASGSAIAHITAGIDRRYTKGSTATIMEPNAIIVAGQNGWANGASQGIFRSLDDGTVRVRGYIVTSGASATYRDCSLVVTKLNPGSYAFGTDDVSERKTSLPKVNPKQWTNVLPKYESGFLRLPSFRYTICRYIKFRKAWPSSVRESDIQVMASVDHRSSGYGHDGIGVWVEYKAHHGFRACVAETGRHDQHHDNNAHISYVTYLRPSSVKDYDAAYGEIAVPYGARHSWCKTVDYSHRHFTERPTVLSTVRHNYRGNGHHDAVHTWVHRADTRTATICFSEYDNRDKYHAHCWLQWMAIPKKASGAACPNSEMLDSGQITDSVYYSHRKCWKVNRNIHSHRRPNIQVTIAARYAHHVTPAEAWVEGIYNTYFEVCADSHRGWHLGSVVLNWAAFYNGNVGNVHSCGLPLSVARKVEKGKSKIVDFSAAINAKKGDNFYVGLACNTMNTVPGSTTYMTIVGLGNAKTVTGADWITNTNLNHGFSSAQVTGGFSQGLYTATADGVARFTATYHVGSGVGSFEHCSIIAEKLGPTHQSVGQGSRGGYPNTWKDGNNGGRQIRYYHQAKVTDFTTRISVRKGDVIYAALATNLWCSGSGCMIQNGGNRMALAMTPDSTANLTSYVDSNWVNGNYGWDSGMSQGLYRAEKDGEVGLMGFYFRSSKEGGHDVVMSYVYSNVIAYKIGTAKRTQGSTTIVPKKLNSGLWVFRRAGDYDPVGPGTLGVFNGGIHYTGGYVARGCWEYRTPSHTKYIAATKTGIYWIRPHGNTKPFRVYCDMDTDGGGWTLLDNDATASATFHSRTLGAVLDPKTQTKGAYLSSYEYSSRPQMLCKSSYYTGHKPWMTLNLVGVHARQYATSVASSRWGHNSLHGEFQYGTTNGNAQQGLGTWLYHHSGRFGSMWVGHGGQPTCACNYYAPHPQSGLGRWTWASHTTCSIWVR